MISVIKVTVALILLTFASLQTAQPQVKVEFHLGENSPGKGLIEVTTPRADQKVYIYPEAIITNKDIIEASAEKNPFARSNLGEVYKINITLTKEAGERMAEITVRNIGKLMAILVNGKAISVGTIQSKIEDKCQIIGNITQEEAEGITKSLNNK